MSVVPTETSLDVLTPFVPDQAGQDSVLCLGLVGGEGLAVSITGLVEFL